MHFTPTLGSVRTHTVPNWFHDAKLGIFAHWGLYSVPGWAAWFGRNPYAEWYLNSIRIEAGNVVLQA